MEPEVTKEYIEAHSINEQADVVNTIILWRIYDTLLLILSELGGDAAALGQMHERGEFIGPEPSVTLEEDDD